MGKTARSKKQMVKRNPRRKFIKKKRSNIMNTVVHRPLAAPDAAWVKLKYTDNNINVFDLSVGSFDYRLFRGNSAYDPDTAVRNYQCYGYAEYAAFYNKVRVHASKIKMTVLKIAGAGVATLPVRICIMPVDLPPGAGVIPQITHAGEAPYSKVKVIGDVSGNRSAITLSNYMSTVKFEGDKGALYDTTFASNVEQLPTNQWYWMCTAQALAGVPGSSLTVQTEITYYCEFYSRKDLSSTIKYFQPGEDPVEPDEIGTVYPPTGL